MSAAAIKTENANGLGTRDSVVPLAFRRACHGSERQGASEARIERDRRWSALMLRAQEGDRLAYDRLLRGVAPFIRAIASRQHRAADQVEEIVQDVLLTIHRMRHTYDPARPFAPWLAAIARCRSIDALRRRFRQKEFEIDSEASALAYERYADPAAHRLADAHATADYLDRAITDLPELQREAIELLKLRELSLAEASRLTGRSIAALKVNVHRAVRALKIQLQAE